MTDNDKLIQAKHLMSSGFSAYCGIEIEEIHTGYCKATCSLQENLMNPERIVHGGATATLMDTAAGFAAEYAVDPPRDLVTRSVDIHFTRPVQGTRMTAEAQAVKVGDKTCLVKTDMYDDQGRLAASAFFEMFYIA